MKPNTDEVPPAGKKPRLTLAIATSLGLGYVPKIPGTVGSLAGIAVAVLSDPVSLLLLIPGLGMDTPMVFGHPAPALFLLPSLIALLLVALASTWSATRVAAYAGASDPQYVVIDEVSGQHLTLVLALMPVGLPTHLIQPAVASNFALYSALSLLNWKYLLAGFILFRVFDIWKPYPVRQLEKLPGGWGIMADDWMAAVYAAAVLRLAIQLGLV